LASMKIGIGQLTSTANLRANGRQVAALIESAYNSRCEALFLPEASDYIAGSPAETVALAKPLQESPFYLEIKAALKKFPLSVSVGFHEPTEPPSNRVRNTLLWLNPQGEVVNRYQKIHLFNADIPNGPILRESNSVEPGKILPDLVSLGPLKIGPQICYDIRFEETTLQLREKGANVLVYPSAFTVKTGEAHWRVLNQARAIDTQSFVISAAQVGRHDPEGKRQSYGHSIAVDPWGTILAESAKEAEDLLIVDLDLDKVAQVRANMPLLEQRRDTQYE